MADLKVPALKKKADDSWLDSAPDANGLDEAADAQGTVADEPIASMDDPEDNFAVRAGNWITRAKEGWNKGPQRGLDYIPIVGPLVTRASLMMEDGDYPSKLEQYKKEKSEYERDYPEADMVKNIAASAPLIFAPPIARLPALAGKTLPMALSRIAAAGAENAAITGVDSKLRGDDNADAFDKSKTAFMFGAGGQAIPDVIEQTVRKGAKLLTNVKDENIDKYMLRSKEINDLDPDVAQIDLSDSINAIKNEGKRREGDLTNKIKSDTYAARDEAAQIRYDAREKVKRTESLANDLADAHLREAADRMAGDIQDARAQVSAASSMAFDVLKKSGAKFNLKQIRSDVYKLVKSRADRKTDPKTGKVSMVLEPTPENKYLLAKLKHLKSIDDDIPADRLKRLIQTLDNEGESARIALMNGDYVNSGKMAAFDLRKIYNKNLLSVPGYDEAMKPVREKTIALSNLMKKQFKNDPDKVYSILKRIKGLGAEDKRRAIQAFEQTFGHSYLDAVNQAERIRAVDHTLSIKPELNKAKALTRQDFRGKYKAEADEIEKFKAPVNNKSADQSLNYLRNYGNRPETMQPLRRDLMAIGKAQKGDENYYLQMADDYAVQRNFEGQAINGSRNVNLMKAVATGVGALIGFTKSAGNSEVAGMIGAVFGASADKIGAAAVKGMLDFALSPVGKTMRPIIINAAQRGPKALISTHLMLLKSNPDYGSFMDKDTGGMPQQMSGDWLDSAPDSE